MMRSLKQYLLEDDESSNEITKVENLEVVYDAKDSPFVVEVPASYNEDDMKIYLDDKCLDGMPAKSELTDSLFGINKSDISDAYFEYAKYEAVDKGVNYINIPWDPTYGQKKIPEGDTIFYKLTNLKYIIKFSTFKVKNVKDKMLRDTLIDIFTLTQSSQNNKYPVEILFDKNSFNINNK